MSNRLYELERKLRGADYELLELRRKVKLAYQRPPQDLLSAFFCVITFDFTVTGSDTGAALSGAAVSILSSGGLVVATGATDSFGACSLTVTGVDAYTYSIAETGYSTKTGTLAVAACGDTVTTAVALDPGYPTCTCGTQPGTLHASESYYGLSWTLTYQAAVSEWQGCTTLNYNQPTLCGGGAKSVIVVLRIALACPGTATIAYQSAGGGGLSGLCPVAGSCGSYPYPYNNSAASQAGPNSVTCSPLNVTWNLITLPTSAGGQRLYPAGVGTTVTVTL